MNFDAYKYAVSEHLIPAIINGDYSGLDDNEDNLLSFFLDSDIFENGHWAIPDSIESSFDRCDIIGLYSDCVILTFYKRID